MTKLVVFLITAAIGLQASAGDHWSFCSSADGSLRIENDVLSQDGLEMPITLKVKSKQVLKNESTNCTIKNTDQKITAYSNEVSIKEIELRSGATKYSVYFLCEEGGSTGIPQDQLINCK